MPHLCLCFVTLAFLGGSPLGASPPPPKPPVVSKAQAQRNTAMFWRWIAETRKAAHNDTAGQSELLKDRLDHSSARRITTFERVRHGFDVRAFTMKLWAAAIVIQDGCDEQCFDDFRGYVISLGRVPYENSMRNPDSLASVAKNADQGDWENADNVAPDAYSHVTGGDYPYGNSALAGRPRGKSFNHTYGPALARSFPRLAARFR
jgi:hypothetical protein